MFQIFRFIGNPNIDVISNFRRVSQQKIHTTDKEVIHLIFGE